MYASTSPLTPLPQRLVARFGIIRFIFIILSFFLPTANYIVFSWLRKTFSLKLLSMANRCNKNRVCDQCVLDIFIPPICRVNAVNVVSFPLSALRILLHMNIFPFYLYHFHSVDAKNPLSPADCHLHRAPSLCVLLFKLLQRYRGAFVHCRLHFTLRLFQIHANFHSSGEWKKGDPSPVPRPSQHRRTFSCHKWNKRKINWWRCTWK